MQFSLGRNRAPSSKGSATNTASNQSSNTTNARSDAMQRAIERNRAKMDKRQSSPARSTPPPAPSASSTRPSNRATAPSSPQASNSSSTVLAKLRAQRDARQAASARPASAPPSRKPISQADNIEMSQPLRKKTTAPAAVNYADQTPTRSLTKAKPSVSAKRKVKAKSKKKGELTHWGVKLCWGFCLFLLGRLIFSQGGVIEYLDKKSTLDQAYHEVSLLTTENENLMKELQLIRKNNQYKKKLVRDHLGYIARDEYLILFPESSETNARGVSAI